MACSSLAFLFNFCSLFSFLLFNSRRCPLPQCIVVLHTRPHYRTPHHTTHTVDMNFMLHALPHHTTPHHITCNTPHFRLRAPHSTLHTKPHLPFLHFALCTLLALHTSLRAPCNTLHIQRSMLKMQYYTPRSKFHTSRSAPVSAMLHAPHST